MRAGFVYLVLTAVCLLLGACASPESKSKSESEFPDLRIETRANPTFAMNELYTYDWVSDTAVVRDPARQWSPALQNVGAEVRKLVDIELGKHGRKVATHAPDLFARLEFGVDMTATAMKVDGEAGSARFEARPTGGIQVVLTDRETRLDVWAGRATGNVTENATPEYSRRRLAYAIAKMFEKFPN